MSETEAEKLLQKIASQQKKNGASRLRDVFDSLEAALLVKTREEVFKELESINLGITFNTFKKTIDRIRKERGITPPRKNKGQPATPTSVPVSSRVLNQQSGDNKIEAEQQHATERERLKAESKSIADYFVPIDAGSNISKYL